MEGQMERPVLSVDTESLLEFFRTAGTPPVLAEVESQKRWLAMRQTFYEMAQMSAMVRSAILAFSNLLLSRQNGTMALSDTKHYQDAIDELSAYHYSSSVDHSSEREYLLAALFFLSYVDILENRLDGAYAHLKRAYTIFQDGNKSKFSAVEKKVLLWLRLLDGKAVSAGGDGIFLSKEDELALVEAPPSSFDGGGDAADEQATDDDVEDMLFQVLYQPGIIFFQKVQSFMARISKIDPWHRSRGTVEDETDVMNIGSVIATDLRTLYEQRPALMDYAVAGKLSQPHISDHLARALSRAFRTYLANYYASKIHLHRVAYKTFPISKEAAESLYQIRRLAKLIARDLDTGDAMPANMLWPLLMLAVEEQNSQERVWIREQILGMEKVVGNARITAQVIEEVQARQEAAKGRMDIRTVMHAVFNAEFAIV
ncbi:fungal specific transcription factor domain-containing protein [Sarocladium implicatum]|nr:fungal specific transcription factor domain-containing protein [Sarocladium implicatum]